MAQSDAMKHFATDAAEAVAEPTAPSPLMASPDRFINRELSWLEFNRRVLEESANPNHPLLERLRFLSISANNLDEFFMVRVAGLVGQVLAGMTEISDDGRTPAEQLERIGERVAELVASQQERWRALRRRARRSGHRHPRRRRAVPPRARLAGGLFPAARLPDADAARGRSGPSVPVHPQSRLHAGARLLNPQDGRTMNALVRIPDQRRSLRPPAGRRRRRDGALRLARTAHRGLHRPAVSRLRGARPGRRSASFATATSKSRKRPKTSCGFTRAR